MGQSDVNGGGGERSDRSAEELGEELFELTRKGAYGGVERLLRLGAPVGHADARGRQALHMACSRGEPRVARALLLGGADPSAMDKSGVSPLGLALEMGGDELAVELLLFGADPHGLDQWGARALRLACERGCPKAIEALLAAGADPNHLGDGVGYGALSALSKERWSWAQNVGDGAEELAARSARRLLAAGANPRARGVDGLMPFEAARMQPWAKRLADELERAAAEMEAKEIEQEAAQPGSAAPKRGGL